MSITNGQVSLKSIHLIFEKVGMAKDDLVKNNSKYLYSLNLAILVTIMLFFLQSCMLGAETFNYRLLIITKHLSLSILIYLFAY